MPASNQDVPSQYSKLFVSELNPIVPFLGFLGLFLVSHDSIAGKPSIIDKPSPISMNSALLAIALKTFYSGGAILSSLIFKNELFSLEVVAKLNHSKIPDCLSVN